MEKAVLLLKEPRYVIPLDGAELTQAEPLEVKTLPLVPGLVKPVPPLAAGNAVPDKLTANVPDVVTGLPLTDKNDGTVIPTEVTVPEPPDMLAHVASPRKYVDDDGVPVTAPLNAVELEINVPLVGNVTDVLPVAVIVCV